jgi:hypothetical protein
MGSGAEGVATVAYRGVPWLCVGVTFKTLIYATLTVAAMHFALKNKPTISNTRSNKYNNKTMPNKD